MNMSDNWNEELNDLTESAAQMMVTLAAGAHPINDFSIFNIEQAAEKLLVDLDDAMAARGLSDEQRADVLQRLGAFIEHRVKENDWRGW